MPYATGSLGPFAFLFTFLPLIAAESFAFATAIGLLSAAIPALVATRHDIAAELRAV
ncbi:MAG TPA: hypothetical protein VIX12_02110 [Candidatus Binataceae bacterium]